MRLTRSSLYGWVASGLAVILLAAVSACSSPAAGTGVPIPPGPRPAHLVVILEENQDLWDVLHRPGYSYLASLYSTGYGFKHYAAIAHPSAPNYRAMISGVPGPLSDTSARFGYYTNKTVFDQLSAAKVSWAWYAEGMPHACYGKLTATSSATQGQYALRHVAALEYASITRDPAKCSHVQPLTALDPAHLPAVAFITPNICHDFHGLPPHGSDPFPNCVKKSTALWKNSDAWNHAMISKLTAAGATVWVTFDECCGQANPEGPDYLAETGAGVKPGLNRTSVLNHYSILRAIEHWYRLPYLGGARDVQPVPLG